MQNLKAICSLFLEKKEFEEKKRTKNKQKTNINVFSEKHNKVPVDKKIMCLHNHQKKLGM